VNLFYKFSAALTAAALAVALLLSAIFFGFQRRTVTAAQLERLDTMARSTAGVLREAELAGDPLMAVDHLSGLCSSRPELASCELDIGRGMRAVKPRAKTAAAAGRILPREVKGGKYSARLNFSAATLDAELNSALAGVHRDLAAAFAGAAAAAALLGLALAWSLTRRLKRLVAEAAAIGEGRFGVKTDARGADEVAELARAFNNMSERLLELETIKKNFTASVTHELRSPLGVIETYAAMLLKEGDRFRPEDLSVFRRIKENSGRLANFVTAMLDLAKIERGKMDLHPVLEDPLALTTDAVDFFKPKAAEKNIRLEARLDGSGKALLDRELMTHVLTNLVSNALKFTPAGGRVTVRAAAAPDKFRVEVEDTGPGLEPGETKKIFSPYSQGAAAQGHGGTGLGLALARSIIELHKGTIGCGAAPGGGALFWFEIPREAPGCGRSFPQ